MTALREISSLRFNAVDFDISHVGFSRGEGSESTPRFVNDGKSVVIDLTDQALSRRSSATVRIKYTLRNPTDGLHFFGPTDKEPEVPYVMWSQGESITNRYWVPCFDHPKRNADDGDHRYGGGWKRSYLQRQAGLQGEERDGTTTFHRLQDKPHAAYLMTLVVGEFHVEQETWRGKPVTCYVPRDRRDDVGRSFGNTVRMIEHFSEIIGVDYPWDKYAQVCAYGFGGGMENTSATTLGTGTLHDERAHLDSSSDGLVAHELAHQWFGDLVTCKDWAHLWLNEGFASYMESVWCAHDKAAKPALPALRAIAANGSNDRTRTAAEDAIEKITAAAPPPTSRSRSFVKNSRASARKTKSSSNALRSSKRSARRADTRRRFLTSRPREPRA